jgi:transposase-like protein
VVYFNGSMAVFTHSESDVRTFRMITSQFCCQGTIRERDVCRVFKVPPITVKRAVKLFREKGAAGFYEKRKTRGPAVLTVSVMEAAQALLDEGVAVSKVADDLGVKRNTMAKAVSAGRLHVNVKKKR